MRSVRIVVTVAGILAAAWSPAAAQTMAKTAAPRPVVDGLTMLMSGIETTVMQTAETTPESLYGYRATADVRTFGQILAHIADAQKALCAATQGGNVNLTDGFEKSATTKAAIVAALRETFAACHAVLASLSDQDAARTVPFGQQPASIATIVAFTISHGNEHYGNLVTYLRLNGIVPPSSRGTR